MGVDDTEDVAKIAFTQENVFTEFVKYNRGMQEMRCTSCPL